MSFSSLPEELKLEVLYYLNENEHNLFIYTFNTTQQKVQQKINPVFIKVLNFYLKRKWEQIFKHKELMNIQFIKEVPDEVARMFVFKHSVSVTWDMIKQ